MTSEKFRKASPLEVSKIENKISRLEKEAPHQQSGKRIVRGMPKEGSQSHIHIIVSRKDASNSVSLSPGSKHKASEVTMHGKSVKRGFNRDEFFATLEKTFDKLFQHKRNYVETYQARKTFLKNPKLYFSVLSGLPTNEKAMAYKMLTKSGVPMMSIPTSKLQLAIKAIKKLKQGMDKAIQSGSIGVWNISIAHIILYIVIPILSTSIVLYVFFHQEQSMTSDKKRPLQNPREI